MPVLAFFAVIGSVLFALLFVADATLEQSGSPVIVTSQRTGLPAPQYDNVNAIKTLTTAPAPAPDMTSQAVLATRYFQPFALNPVAFSVRQIADCQMSLADEFCHVDFFRTLIGLNCCTHADKLPFVRARPPQP